MKGSGFVQCDDGLVHRPSAGVCPAYAPSAALVPPSPVPERDECHGDSDCSAKPYGRCLYGGHPYGGTPFPTSCTYACTVDSDCEDGNICVCNETFGTCSRSDCVLDADCGAGRYCAAFSPTCGSEGGFACQSEEDACTVASDCPSGLVCGLRDGTRACELPQCAS